MAKPRAAVAASAAEQLFRTRALHLRYNRSKQAAAKCLTCGACEYTGGSYRDMPAGGGQRTRGLVPSQGRWAWQGRFWLAS